MLNMKCILGWNIDEDVYMSKLAIITHNHKSIWSDEYSYTTGQNNILHLKQHIYKCIITQKSSDLLLSRL